MSNDLDLRRGYQSDTLNATVRQSDLDNAFDDIEAWAVNQRLNDDQVKLDLYGSSGHLDNDGNKNLSQSVVDEIKRPSRLQWEDHFMEVAAALASTGYSSAHWTGGGTAGTQAIVAGVGGWLRLDTTATLSRSSTLTFTSANFDTNYAPHIQFSFSTSNITNTEIRAGFRASANDYIYFQFNTATDANNIYLATNNNSAGEVQDDTGVNLNASQWNEFRIEIASDETFKVYINDVQVAQNATGTIRQLATFVPYFYVDNKAANEQKLLDIDFVRLSQDRI